jgi:GrpB-like predicted nucleotidyltransferase (UPF0157 family)
MTEPVLFVPESAVRDRVSELFDAVHAYLSGLLPEADIQHVGSTAIPGSLTKGDLDIQVRVCSEAFDTARNVLTQHYKVNAGGFVADDAISFEDYGTEPPHGVHLTVVDGSCDIQWRFRDALIASSELAAAYDALKRSFDGESMADYRNAKDEFVLEVQASEPYRRLGAVLPGDD